MSIGLHIVFIFSVICFLKASMILNMKVVPDDKFKFGGERVYDKSKSFFIIILKFELLAFLCSFSRFHKNITSPINDHKCKINPSVYKQV